MPYEFEHAGQKYQVDTPEELKIVLQNLPDAKDPFVNTGIRSGVNKPPTLDKDVAAALVGFAQGGSFDAVPSVQSTIGPILGDNRTKQDYQKAYEALSKESNLYTPAYIAGSYMIGKPLQWLTKLGKAATGFKATEKAGLVNRMLTNATENAVASAISGANTDQGALSGGIFGAGTSLGLDAILGTLGKGGQLIKAKVGEIQTPKLLQKLFDLPEVINQTPGYKPDVNVLEVEAAEALKRETEGAKDLRLAPEQILKYPNMLQSGIDKDLVKLQENALQNVGKELESAVGLSSGKASAKYTQIQYDPLAPRLEPVSVANEVGENIISNKKAVDESFVKRFANLEEKLTTQKLNDFYVKNLNKEIVSLRKQLKGPLGGTGLTAQKLENFLDSMAENGFTGIKGKVNLANLNQLRKEASDLAYETTSDIARNGLEKIKKSIDSEINNIALKLQGNAPELAKEIISLNKDYIASKAPFENSIVSSAINKFNTDDLINRDPSGLAEKISTAIKKGNINALQAIERVVPEQTMIKIKQQAAQDILRGNNKDAFDFAGISERMKGMSSESKKFIFGDDYMKYENLGIVGKHVEDTWKSIAQKEQMPNNVGEKNPRTYTNYVGYLASKFNNFPAVTKLLTRDYKKIITPSAASFAAKRYVEKLFELERIETGQDNRINTTTGE